MTEVERTGIIARMAWGIKANAATGCWEWQKGRNRQGYGKIKALGKDWQAHRLAWTVHRGAIPPAFGVLHHCDNPGCVNPDHLFLGTAQDNVDDLLTKRPDVFANNGPPKRVPVNRVARESLPGVQRPPRVPKWDPAKVAEAVQLRAGGMTLAEVKNKTGVPVATITKAATDAGIGDVRRWPKERIDRALQMLVAGKKLREVAAELDCPVGSVQVATGFRKHKPHVGRAKEILGPGISLD